MWSTTGVVPATIIWPPFLFSSTRLSAVGLNRCCIPWYLMFVCRGFLLTGIHWGRWAQAGIHWGLWEQVPWVISLYKIGLYAVGFIFYTIMCRGFVLICIHWSMWVQVPWVISLYRHSITPWVCAIWFLGCRGFVCNRVPWVYMQLGAVGLYVNSRVCREFQVWHLYLPRRHQ